MDPKKTVVSETKLDATYWNNKYVRNEIGWDIGYANPVLVDFVLHNFKKECKILIPGLGNGYELEALWKNGYKNAIGLDLAPAAREAFITRVPDFPSDNYVLENFFDHSSKYDLIVEQTFFCALNPSLRAAYTIKMLELLEPKGQLAGLLFNFNREVGPPFGGDKEEYTNLFSSDFQIVKMDICKESIAPRLGNEYFFQLIKK